MIAPDRLAADRCPGVLRPHLAADGAVVRVRIPGGQITVAALVGLSQLSSQFADGHISLTSRANLQLRGIEARDGLVPAALADGLYQLGLVPSVSHERVRNILASPMSGLLNGSADLRPLVRELDAALIDAALLADLPGRFLFALDDRGDQLASGADLTYLARSPQQGVILVGGYEIHVQRDDAVGALIALAAAFVRSHGATWRITELPDAGAQLLSDVGLDAKVATERTAWRSESYVGLLAPGVLGTHPPLGLLRTEHVAAIGAIAGASQLIVTAGRSLIMRPKTADFAALTGSGLVIDPASPWLSVSACTGAPGCASGTFSSRDEARRIVAAGVTCRVHVTACARGCGSPNASFIAVTSAQTDVT
ncbi:MAG: precorrin-3B synthase [Antricoccus sp.]